MIGYNMRFLEILRLLKQYIEKQKLGMISNFFVKTGQYLPDWRPKQNLKDSISLKRQLGGGVLLELSHEIDYLRWIIGPERAIQAYLHNSKIFKSNVEDSAHIVIEYTTGIIANIYLDMLSKPKERKIYINGTKGSVFVDLIKNEFKFKNKFLFERARIEVGDRTNHCNRDSSS